MAKDKNKKKRIKKEQEKRKRFNKENRVIQKISYEEYMDYILETDFKSDEWLIMENRTKNQVTYILNHLKAQDIMTMEYKLTEAFVAFIKCCERLYSPLISKNEELKKETCHTVVNHYRSKFEIRFSAEISILPLELRLFIYLEMLKRESSKYNIVNILNRISVTLNKMSAGKEYEASIYLLTWAQMMLFLTTEPTKYYENFHYSFFTKCSNNVFSELMLCNYTAINPTRNLREEILEQERIAAFDNVSKEFWYGVKIFIKKKEINDLRVAKACLHLFSLYFEKVFLFVKEFEKLVNDYYRGNDGEELSQFIEEHKWDEPKLNELRRIYTDIESKDKSDADKHKSLILQSNRDWIIDKNEISPEEYSVQVNKLLNKISNEEDLYIPDLEDYIIRLTTGMLASSDWDETLLMIMLHNINMFRGHLWESQDIDSLIGSIEQYFKRILLLDMQKDIIHVGEGKSIALIYGEDGPVAFHSSRNGNVFITSVRFLLGCSREEIVEAFTKLKDYIVDADFHQKMFLPQSSTYPGWHLFEMTLDEKTKEKRQIGWEKLGVYKSRNHKLRNTDVEEYLFSINQGADKKYCKNIDYKVFPSNEFEKDMECGVLAYRRKKYVIAVKEFLNLIEKYPEEGILYYYIANAFSYMQEGRAYALRFYEKALEYRDYVEIWVDYGNVLRSLQRTEEAITVLENARIRFRDNGSPSMVLTSIYREDAALYKIVKSEAVRKKSAKFNEIIREWESEHQILKPVIEEFI